MKPTLKPFIGKWSIMEVDCRLENTGGKARIAFSWEGQEKLDPASGRGWAVIENGELQSRIFLHQEDNSV